MRRFPILAGGFVGITGGLGSEVAGRLTAPEISCRDVDLP
jgi:hypothetical protein